MKDTTFLIILFLFFNISYQCSCQESDSTRIVIHTTFGDIEAELFLEDAPITCSNFMRYIRICGNEGGSFYRTVTAVNQPGNRVKIEVVQGGFNTAKLDSAAIVPILLERTNLTGVLHKDGTLSMARDAPDSGSTEFFICIGDQPSLDYMGERNPDGQGFAAFGRVTRGMDVVRKIQSAPSEGQRLTPLVEISGISRL